MLQQPTLNLLFTQELGRFEGVFFDDLLIGRFKAILEFNFSKDIKIGQKKNHEF